MVIDNEKKANDDIYEIGGFEYLVDKSFMVKAAPIKIDFNSLGFQISSAIQPAADAGGCGGCGGSCG